MGQLSSAVKSCQQLLTADKNQNQPRELKIGTGISFRAYENSIQFYCVTAVISCQKLLTADKNENQPGDLKFGTHFILKT